MHGMKVFAFACMVSAGLLIVSGVAIAKEVVAVKYVTPRTPVRAGPYVVTVEELRGGDQPSITFSIENKSTRVVGMPGASAACAESSDAFSGSSLVPNAARPSWLHARQIRRHVLYEFQPAATTCSQEVRLALDVPGDGRFTQLRVRTGVKVRGALVLASRSHWTASGRRSCVGAGLYGDVAGGMRVVVRGPDHVALTQTKLGPGTRTAGGCRLPFALVLPKAAVYTFEIGPRGSVFQESWDDAGLRLVRHQLAFVLPY